MILTLTANPSFDHTVELSEPLVPGEVLSASAAFTQAGGKGINVATVCSNSSEKIPTFAVTPANTAFENLLKDRKFTTLPVRVDEIRTNITAVDPQDSSHAGRTTKINHAGYTLDSSAQDQLTEIIVSTTSRESSTDSHTENWAALAGSTPPGVDENYYPQLIGKLRQSTPGELKIVADTSGTALHALVNSSAGVPDLIKPNAAELASLTGGDPDTLEDNAAKGDYEALLNATELLHGKGIKFILVSLGSAGALLSTTEQAWFARAPKVDVRSTVGAGDSTLAGFMIARHSGKSLEESLATAVLYGTTAVTLPGTTLPDPSNLIDATPEVSPI